MGPWDRPKSPTANAIYNTLCTPFIPVPGRPHARPLRQPCNSSGPLLRSRAPPRPLGFSAHPRQPNSRSAEAAFLGSAPVRRRRAWRRAGSRWDSLTLSALGRAREQGPTPKGDQHLARDPNYRPFTNTAITSTGLPSGLSPPLPQAKSRPFRPALRASPRNPIMLGFLFRPRSRAFPSWRSHEFNKKKDLNLRAVLGTVVWWRMNSGFGVGPGMESCHSGI